MQERNGDTDIERRTFGQWGKERGNQRENVASTYIHCVCVCSIVSDSVSPWTVLCQDFLSIGCSRYDYWNGLPLPSPVDLPNPGTGHQSLVLAELQADSLLLHNLGTIYICLHICMCVYICVCVCVCITLLYVVYVHCPSVHYSSVHIYIYMCIYIYTLQCVK